jgi:hypothetical protein
VLVECGEEITAGMSSLILSYRCSRFRVGIVLAGENRLRAIASILSAKTQRIAKIRQEFLCEPLRSFAPLRFRLGLLFK